MLSFRSFTRALPRSITSVSAHCPRRSLSTVPRISFLQHSWKTAPRSRFAPFSTSTIAWEKEGQVDQDLAAKLESELSIEKDLHDSEQLPASIKDFLDNSPFKLEDIPGQEEVVLTRDFGNEKIRVTFSVADLDSMDEEPDEFADDRAQYDEQEDTAQNAQSGGAQSKGTITHRQKEDGNFSTDPKDGIGKDNELASVDDAADDPNSASQPGFPVRLNVTIEKPEKGAVQVEAIAQDGELAVENVRYFTNVEFADAKTAELDWSKRKLYSGPPFGNLDEELQLLLERYLYERGIDTALALMAPEYIDFKEQREYISWLSNAKAFVEA